MKDRRDTEFYENAIKDFDKQIARGLGCPGAPTWTMMQVTFLCLRVIFGTLLFLLHRNNED